MKITWVTRSFLDYRIPVFNELDTLCGGKLTLLYNKEIHSGKLITKVESILGERAIGFCGELRLGGKKIENAAFSNTKIRIPYQKGLIAKILETKPDVTVSDGFMQWTYAPLWARFIHKIPHVMCYERTMYTERNCQWYRTLYRKFALKGIDAVCANGILCGEYLKSLGFAPENIFYGQMAADTNGLKHDIAKISEREASDIRAQFPCKGPLFLYVGQIIPRKGIRQLLYAWKNFNDPNAGLILVGDGCEYKALKQWSQENNLKKVFWMGRQPYDEIAKFYHIADVFIIPTLEDNWSLVVPEAMACGLPVACSKYNGCHPELVTPENGWIFDPLDSTGMAEMLKQIIKSRSEFRNMGKTSERIVANFSPANAAKVIYQACTNTRHKLKA